MDGLYVETALYYAIITHTFDATRVSDFSIGTLWLDCDTNSVFMYYCFEDVYSVSVSTSN